MGFRAPPPAVAPLPVPAAPVQSPDLPARVIAGNVPDGKAIQFIGDERVIVRLLNGYPADWDDNGARPVRGIRAYLAAALAYICIRYRATKVRQAPLMVVRETRAGEEWIRNHPANAVLKKPNPDYGMRRLIEATETFLCLTGACLWVKNRDRMGRVGMIYPFGGDDFTVESDGSRLYSNFVVRDRDVKPEDVVFFSYFSPLDPLGYVAPLDAALSQLNIASALTARVKSHVRNALTPGAIYIADKDWNADDKEFARLKRELGNMLRGANSGETAIAEGGGKIERGWSLSDLELGELYREVEATVCAVFGVPPSLVGTVVGLENSPWSHLETAKRSFYDETIIPEWETLEEPITDSLLRDFDDDPTHYVRFDTSRVTALQRDLQVQATIASTVAKFTSVNERRVMIGLQRSEEEGADDIPELSQTLPPPPAPPAADNQGDPASGNTDAGKSARRRRFASVEWKRFASLRHAYVDDLAIRHASSLELVAARQLQRDGDEIAAIVRAHLTDGKSKAAPAAMTAREKERLGLALDAYLDGDSAESWAKAVRPTMTRVGEDAISATVVPDLGIDARLLRPHLGDFIDREVGFLITNVSDTTKEKVRKALTASLDAGEGIDGTVRRIRGDTAFNRARATLIGRTETTRTLNGAPLETLTAFGEETGQSFTKTWLATDDDRVRDEHWAMNGETVPMKDTFSNGLAHPGEPNCRCGLTYGIEGVE